MVMEFPMEKIFTFQLVLMTILAGCHKYNFLRHLEVLGVSNTLSIQNSPSKLSSDPPIAKGIIYH